MEGLGEVGREGVSGCEGVLECVVFFGLGEFFFP